MKTVLFSILFVTVIESTASAAKSIACTELAKLEIQKNRLLGEMSQIEGSNPFLPPAKQVRNKEIFALRGNQILRNLEAARKYANPELQTQPSNLELIKQVETTVRRVKLDSYSLDAANKLLSYARKDITHALNVSVFHGQIDNRCPEAHSKGVQIRGVKSAR